MNTHANITDPTNDATESAVDPVTQLGKDLESRAEWCRDQAEREPEKARFRFGLAEMFARLSSEIDNDDDQIVRYVELVTGDELDASMVREVTSDLNDLLCSGFTPVNIGAYMYELNCRLEGAA